MAKNLRLVCDKFIACQRGLGYGYSILILGSGACVCVYALTLHEEIDDEETSENDL